MKTEIWFDCVDDDRDSIVIKEGDPLLDPDWIVIPDIGESVGLWPVEDLPGDVGKRAMQLHHVVDVRHFFAEGTQEIHVMLSVRR